MPITAHQLVERRKAIGSSMMAGILGVDPHANAYDHWAFHTDRIGELGRASAAADLGNDLEHPVLAWAEREHLGDLRRNQRRVNVKLYLAANIDAIVTASGQPVDAKTHGILGPADNEQWGEAGTDEVPERVVVQCHVHMLCLGDDAQVCHVPALIGGRGYVMFEVPRSRELCEIIADRAVDYWENHVLADVPPDVTPSLSTLKALRRVPNKVVPIPTAMFETWEHCKAVAKAAESDADLAKQQLIAALGDAEAGDLGDGRLVTYFRQTRAAYSVKASEFPVLRVKKGKP